MSSPGPYRPAWSSLRARPESTCFKCAVGMLHPWHDWGESNTYDDWRWDESEGSSLVISKTHEIGLPDHQRVRLCRWLERHGFDPMRVFKIEHTGYKEAVIWQYVLDSEGKKYVISDRIVAESIDYRW